MGRLPFIIAIFLEDTCERTMEPLEKTFKHTYEWALDSIVKYYISKNNFGEFQALSLEQKRKFLNKRNISNLPTSVSKGQ